MQIENMREQFEQYRRDLASRELSLHTVQKYSRDVRLFLESIPNTGEIEKKTVLAYRESLLVNHKAVSVNASVVAINRFFSWMNCPELAVKAIRIQRQTGHENIISQQEYSQLLAYCLQHNKKRNYLLLRTLAATGMRAGELKALTYQAVLCRQMTVYGKAKIRAVFIPDELAERLLDYCGVIGVAQGTIFLGRGGEPIQPGSVWRMMKRMAVLGGIAPEKAYPHSLRHLFAKTYMRKIGNIFELADLLGHSSIETTRIYALSSQEDKMKAINTLGL